MNLKLRNTGINVEYKDFHIDEITNRVKDKETFWVKSTKDVLLGISFESDQLLKGIVEWKPDEQEEDLICDMSRFMLGQEEKYIDLSDWHLENGSKFSVENKTQRILQTGTVFDVDLSKDNILDGGELFAVQNERKEIFQVSETKDYMLPYEDVEVLESINSVFAQMVHYSESDLSNVNSPKGEDWQLIVKPLLAVMANESDTVLFGKKKVYSVNGKTGVVVLSSYDLPDSDKILRKGDDYVIPCKN